ncbi:unnamed protein product [Thelazia callipaeda]|uniref:HMG box domain-containing protein n=1 Tax=Thelazia callipaeda TaxID=103827 RepID=A0A0N5D2S5_THECL|nr:unnamed protein product [Thelazia callipaeda]
MTKKRSSNGFMYFADARRSFYEEENKGVHLTLKKLVERATRDWKIMSEEERLKWRGESRRRRDEYQQKVYQMQSVSIMNKSKTRPLSKLELSLQPKPFSYKLTESKRKSQRQSIYQKLVWREKENMTEVLAKKKFGLLTVRPYCLFESDSSNDEVNCLPAEICIYVMNLSDGIVESERILIHHDCPNNHSLCQIFQISEVSEKPNHVNLHHACLRIASKMKGCLSNLILVPASQYQNMAASLTWIKQKRDMALKRDTTSIRKERLMCMEDMIAVIGRIFEIDVDDSSRWEQSISSNLSFACDQHCTAPNKCAVVIGKSACEHFLNTLRTLTDRNYRIYDEGFTRNDDNTKHHIRQITRTNRMNPFQMPLCHEPMNVATEECSKNSDSFSAIRTCTRTFTSSIN